jgi:hypothetical protein
LWRRAAVFSRLAAWCSSSSRNRFSKSLASMARRTARREGTVETEPQCRLIAGKRQLDGLGRQFRGSPSSNISAARVARLEEPRGRPAGLPDPALGEPPAPVPRFLFPLFYLVEIRHPFISFAHPAPSALPERHEARTLWQFWCHC